jgi:hypothetical protein
MGYPRSHLAAANAASVDRFLNSVTMKVGAYTLDETTIPTEGARHIEITHTTDTTTDTLGTVTCVGTNLAGETITEVITPVADSLVAGTKWFVTLASATGAGWVQAGGVSDLIEIGYGDAIALVEGTGTLHAVVVNTTAAGAITLADDKSTIGILAASVVEGLYEFDATFYGHLTVDLAAASDITVLHSGNLPTSYAMA